MKSAADLLEVSRSVVHGLVRAGEVKNRIGRPVISSLAGTERIPGCNVQGCTER
jgi:hypothetical protein